MNVISSGRAGFRDVGITIGLKQRLFVMLLCTLHIHHCCDQLDTTDSLLYQLEPYMASY